MNLEKLNALKQKVVDTQDLAEVWNDFFDHFGQRPEFIQSGQRTQHPKLQQMVESLGKEMANPAAASAELLLSEIPQYHFYHGACFLSGKMVSLLYFSDVNVGITAVGTFGNGTTFSRFSC
ncbi:hypothetical protein [Thioflexithrix psekupsensis]|uniref:Uncharacterized protein n=1 Tax=Thioflexithrix psekupsensis TaxID=1570016 RepID=A0A251XCX5_9GAMM|nr:hypothetical protein [Thioflexithrix psekupsensis]OUD16225.1 hypothetical protein TPSD3_00420 [Thioflexithrix psekupsensis]